MNPTEFFARKVGPLPLGMWVLGVSGGLGVAYVLRRNRANAPVGTSYDETADYGLTGAPGAVSSTNPGTGGAAVSDPSYFAPDYEDTPATDAPVITTNNQWRRAALAAVGGTLGRQVALDRYLTGKKLTRTQQSVVEEAIRKVGPTPQPVPTPVLTPAPSTGGTGSTPPATNPGTGSGGSTGSTGGTTGGGANGTNKYPNNAAWREAGIKVLTKTAAGYTEARASQTLNHYLRGDTLSVGQRGAVQRVIATIGPPPYPPKPAAPGTTVVANPTTGAVPAAQPFPGGQAVPAAQPYVPPKTNAQPTIPAPASTPAPTATPPKIVAAPIRIATPTKAPVTTRKDTGTGFPTNSK